LTLEKRGRYNGSLRRIASARRSCRIPTPPKNAHALARVAHAPPFSEDAFVNKNDLIDAISRHADISKAAAGRALDATMNSIKGSLKKGDIVTLVGFGSFYVGRRTARAGRNPRTGDTIRIQAAKVPKFRAGKALKDELK
jgi:DNA-binding protein HU-beta